MWSELAPTRVHYESNIKNVHYWILGRGGMFGSSLARGFVVDGIEFGENIKLNWSSPLVLKNQIFSAVEQFSKIVANESWTILWCAGIGTVGATEAVLQSEEHIVEFTLFTLLERLGERISNGALFYSSSAGAMYAGSKAAPMTEDTGVVPLSAYGAQKKRIEIKFGDFSSSTGARVVIGRIANLYGPLQNRSKGQGLITSICQNTLQRKPVNIFVGLDTMRNFIFVDDAAKVAMRVMRGIHSMPTGTKKIKVICSLTNHSISNLLNECDLVFGSAPQVVQSKSNHESSYPKDLRLKSVRELKADEFEHTPLIVGINRVWESLKIEQQRGLLAESKSRFT